MANRAAGEPIFSIVTATYNRAHLIERSLTSILQQTLPSFELIVVDDASTDATSEVVGGFQSPLLRYIRQPINQGVGHARNVGIAAARGEFIVFVDDDDTIVPEFLDEVYRVIQHLPASCGFFWTWKYIVAQKGDEWEVLRTMTYDVQDSQPRPGHLYFDTLPGGSCGLIVRADCLKAVGGFDESFRALGDTDLMIRLAYDHDYAVIPKPLYHLARLEGAQLTKPTVARAQANEKLIMKHYTLFRQRTFLLATSYRRIAKMYFAAQDRANGRRIMRKLLHTFPLSIKSYGLWLVLEMLELLPASTRHDLVTLRR